MLSNEIKRLKLKIIKFENLEKKNPEIRHLPTNHPDTDVDWERKKLEIYPGGTRFVLSDIHMNQAFKK